MFLLDFLGRLVPRVRSTDRSALGSGSKTPSPDSPMWVTPSIWISAQLFATLRPQGFVSPVFPPFKKGDEQTYTSRRISHLILYRGERFRVHAYTLPLVIPSPSPTSGEGSEFWVEPPLKRNHLLYASVTHPPTLKWPNPYYVPCHRLYAYLSVRSP